MIKCRFYCGKCLLRVEAEIVTDSKTGKEVYGYNGRSVEELPTCPTCGREMPYGKFKIIRDVPDRYIDANGALKVREYKDIKD